LTGLERLKKKPGKWNPSVKRTGVIAVKVGMFPQYTEYYERIPVTCLWIPNCQVVQVKTKQKEGKFSLQLGAGDKRVRKTTKPLLGHFKKAGVEPKKLLTEFEVSEDALLPVGTEITSRHFVPGQFVDITGYSKGKGFQGVMKRWKFRGQPATHGVSVTHRSHGSIGQQGAQHTFKGKKMAGRMGGKKNYKRNLWVYMIDKKMNCVFVKGSVPGAKGSFITIVDAQRRMKTFLNNPPPVPTFIKDNNESFENVKFEDTLLKAKSKRPAEWGGYTEKGDAIQETDEQVWDYIEKVREIIRDKGSAPGPLEIKKKK